MLKVDDLPPVLQKEAIAGKLARICKEHDVVFLAIFGSFARQDVLSSMKVIYEER